VIAVDLGSRRFPAPTPDAMSSTVSAACLAIGVVAPAGNGAVDIARTDRCEATSRRRYLAGEVSAQAGEGTVNSQRGDPALGASPFATATLLVFF